MLPKLRGEAATKSHEGYGFVSRHQAKAKFFRSLADLLATGAPIFSGAKDVEHSRQGFGMNQEVQPCRILAREQEYYLCVWL